ncbi:hypothetical protein [Oleiagrimonas soli]|uniref:Uncharacterized protein n=1 Tax=Oleiagrimonas soli TaxID=1543381 RepID=A0A099CY85_9GAMM|nr:hypothetical protein [Oleiagrimonas soli]KGI78532.1 hypothetical protein LF63_0103435 [Oleiagrimonas soli]MBB6184199.1 hypothetical protein [Oleiagrimonas soli]
MNEFEWQRQTRDLRRPHAPQRDLWSGIAAQLEPRASAPSAPRAWLPSLAAAAMILIGLLMGTALLRAPTSLYDGARLASDHSQRWKPHDPRLAGAAIEFLAADSEIRLALKQAPDADFLRRIQHRTQAQQWRLQRYAQRAP